MIHPTLRPLGEPATGYEANLALDRLGFFTTQANVCCIRKLLLPKLVPHHNHKLYPNTCLAVPLQSAVGEPPGYSKRSFNHFAVMSIHPGNRQANRYTLGFSQQTSFNALFGPIRGIWAGFFPRQAGPCNDYDLMVSSGQIQILLPVPDKDENDNNIEKQLYLKLEFFRDKEFSESITGFVQAVLPPK